jgi:hypothetical protein
VSRALGWSSTEITMQNRHHNQMTTVTVGGTDDRVSA